MIESYEYLFKFLVIGNGGTGKSCILQQFTQNKFTNNMPSTVGVQFGSKIVTVGGVPIKLQIWDTAGQERFRSVTHSYYRGAAGALIVYDITSYETFKELTGWLSAARSLGSPDIALVMVGNKKDLEIDRAVDFLEASQFAMSNDLLFLETSALTGENIMEAFLKCARTILIRIESGELDPDTVGSGVIRDKTNLQRRLTRLQGSRPQQKRNCCS